MGSFGRGTAWPPDPSAHKLVLKTVFLFFSLSTFPAGSLASKARNVKGTIEDLVSNFAVVPFRKSRVGGGEAIARGGQFESPGLQCLLKPFVRVQISSADYL